MGPGTISDGGMDSGTVLAVVSSALALAAAGMLLLRRRTG
jgi:hypothetical protein